MKVLFLKLMAFATTTYCAILFSACGSDCSLNGGNPTPFDPSKEATHMTICVGQPIPDGYLLLSSFTDNNTNTACNGGECNKLSLVGNLQNLSSGTVLQVVDGQQVPNGWKKVGTLPGHGGCDKGYMNIQKN